MIAKVTNTEIPGCMRLQAPCSRDVRGTFIKSYHVGCFAGQGLDFKIAEVYYSSSRQGVLRGLHFQVPPADHIKAVCCVSGAVLDVVVDLRLGSPTYGKHVLVTMSAEHPEILYIPRGLAHGFLVISPEATLLYYVSTVHTPEADCGIRWDTCDIPWGVTHPILSDRDSRFPSLAAFKSPFRYTPAAGSMP